MPTSSADGRAARAIEPLGRAEDRQAGRRAPQQPPLDKVERRAGTDESGWQEGAMDARVVPKAIGQVDLAP